MKDRLLKFWALLMVVGISAAVVYFVQRECGGEFIYPLDDSYIHLAMAKNLARYGVWGIEPERMAFCSSSPFWTLLLAASVRILPEIAEFLPLILSAILGVGVLWMVDGVLGRLDTPPLVRFAATSVFCLVVPIPVIGVLGMEHALHSLMIVSAMYCALQSSAPRYFVGACCFAFAATATRYESLFLLLPLSFMAALSMKDGSGNGIRRYILRVFAFSLSAVFPVVVYGVWAVVHGGYWLPNSLLLKGHFYTFVDLVESMFMVFTCIPKGTEHIYALWGVLLMVIFLRGTPLRFRLAATALVVALWGQCVLAAISPDGRYEAWLMAGGFFCTLGALAAGRFDLRPILFSCDKVKARRVGWLLFAMLVMVMVCRGGALIINTPKRCHDIYAQQVQMTRMMASLPQGEKGTIALNDLGYMALYSGAKVFDIWGLGSQDAARARICADRGWLKEDIDRLFKENNVQYMLLFGKWFPEAMLPAGTILVAVLDTPGNTTCGQDSVNFLACDRIHADYLKEHLSHFVSNTYPGSKLILMY